MMTSKQTQWHTKPQGETLCSVCGCDNVRAGTTHRALNADEAFVFRAAYAKKVKVGFGMDTSIEAIKPKGGAK